MTLLFQENKISVTCIFTSTEKNYLELKSLQHCLWHKVYWVLHILLQSRDWGCSTVEGGHHLTKRADAYLKRQWCRDCSL